MVFILHVKTTPQKALILFNSTYHTWSSSVISIKAGTLIFGDVVSLNDEIHALTKAEKRKRQSSGSGGRRVLPGHGVKQTVIVI